jgi:hypothetical protein
MSEGAALHGRVASLARCRVILYLVLGLAGVDGLVAAHRATWRAWDPDDYRIRLHGCRRRQPDLVVVGGSPVSEGIDPAVLTGLLWRGRSLERVYNLGLPGATTAEVWLAVKHGLPRPPCLLVYGITASDLNDDRVEPQGPRALMDTQDVIAWVRCRRWSAAEWGLRHFIQGRFARLWNLFYYRNGIRLWAADWAEGHWPGVCPQAAAEARLNRRHSESLRRADGFAPRSGIQSGRLDYFKATHAIARFSFLDHFRLGELVAYLHRLLDWAEVQSVEVVLVDMPVSADLEERSFPRAFAAYREMLADLEKTRSVRLLRANRDVLGLDDADFADLVHLNARGSARLSAWLRHQLASAGGDREEAK